MSFKRKKVTGAIVFPGQPIIFQNPGQVPDVRITVFGQEYHVHSVILRLYSNFFRRFMDAPSREEPAQYALFAYEYAAMMDDDGEWGLEAVSAEAQDNCPGEAQLQEWDSLLPDNRCIYTEAASFSNILKAMYHRPITIGSFFQFADTARLADFYCSLPILCASIDSILLNLIPPPEFISRPPNLPRDRRKMLGDWFCTHTMDMCILAYKLRHARLFHDALIFVAGKWPRMLFEYERNNSPEWNWSKELEPYPKIMETISYAVFRLVEVQSAVANNLRRDAATCPWVSDMVNEVERYISRRDPDYAKRTALEMAWFYRKLKCELEDAIRKRTIDEKWRYFVAELDVFLKCDLILVDELSMEVVRDQFCCQIIEEGMMPWEREDIDW